MTAVLLPFQIGYHPANNFFEGGGIGNSLGSTATVTFDSAGDKMALIFDAAEVSATPDGITFNIRGFTVGTDGDFQATIEGVDTATGTPDGTPLTGSNTVTSTITTTGNKKITGIAGTASLAGLSQVAIVLTAIAGTSTWNRTATLALGFGTAQGVSAFPYIASYNGTSWSINSGCNTGWPMGALDAAGDGMVIAHASGGHTAAYQNFSSSTNPNRRGNWFTVDAPMTCTGARLVMNMGSPDSGDDHSVLLYSDPLGTPTLLASSVREPLVSAGSAPRTYLFDTEVSLSPGTVYGVVLAATDTATKGFLRADFLDAASMKCLAGGVMASITRNGDSGAFTEVDNQLYAIAPLVREIDDATGGSGGGSFGRMIGA